MNKPRIEIGLHAFPIGILYPLAIVLVVLPLADVMIGLIPPRFGQMQWRVGATGLVSGAMLFPLVGFVAATASAHLLGHRWTQRVLAALSVVVGLGFLVALVLFAFDVIQIRRNIPAQNQRAYDLAAAKGFITQAMLAGMFFALGVVSFRYSRLAAKRAARAKRSDAVAAPVLGVTAKP